MARLSAQNVTMQLNCKIQHDEWIVSCSLNRKFVDTIESNWKITFTIKALGALGCLLSNLHRAVDTSASHFHLHDV